MLLSLSRRFSLFLSSIFIVTFALIFVHSLHESGEFLWQAAAAGLVLSPLVLIWNWVALVKTDDYLIPPHTWWFFIGTAVLLLVGGVSLFGYFIFNQDHFPKPYLIYFGAIPAGIGAGYFIFALVRIKEAYVLPPEYRPHLHGPMWGVVPALFSLIGLVVAAGSLFLTVRDLQFEPQFDSTPRERPAVEDSERRALGEEFFQRAKEQQEENQYRHAFELFQKAAEFDHTEANYELGLIYSGDGYLRDLSLARGHFNTARENGHLEATYRLGRAYRHGELGATPDYERAREYLTAAAEAGHMEAQTQLGHLYNRGEGVAVDNEEAFRWFKKAAEQGDPVAQNDLGIFYTNGTGVERDPEEGFYWMGKAADQGVTVALYNLGRALHEGTLLPQDYERSFEYFSQLAEKNIPFGFQMVGLQYFEGQGVEQDYAAAVEAFSEGAARGNLPSKYYLGYCHLNGLGTEKDSSAAFELLEEAADDGHLEAQLLVGRLYLEGDVILQDRAGAAKWFSLAAENGSEKAAAELEALEPQLTDEERAALATM